jgi:hypothetical protein
MISEFISSSELLLEEKYQTVVYKWLDEDKYCMQQQLVSGKGNKNHEAKIWLYSRSPIYSQGLPRITYW